MTDTKTASLDNKNIALDDGFITVYNFDFTTREYIYSNNEYLAVGVGIPANSCIDPPPQLGEKQAALRLADGTGWTIVPDFRGETVYSIESGVALIVSDVGDLPATVTTLIPSTPYDKWDGAKWVTDAAALHAADVALAESQRAALNTTASAKISILLDAVNLNIATDVEKEQLTAWQTYRVLLSRVDTSAVPNIAWPALPTATTEVTNG